MKVKHQYIEWICPIVILLVAAYFRMGFSGIVEFKRDEANLSLLALDVAHGVHFPLLGIGSSVGLPNAPINVYILAIPYFFDSNPQIATQFIGLLNVLAIGMTYLFTKRYVGIFPAFIVALIFALNPWAIIFSRKIWAQNMLLLFVVLTVTTGILGFVENKRWAQFLHLPLLVITGQIHYGAIVLIPVSLYVMWYQWHKTKRLSWLLLISWVFAGLLVVPFAVGMLDAGFSNLSKIKASLNTTDTASDVQVTSDAFRSAALMLAGTEIHSLAGPVKFEKYLASIPSGIYTYWGVLSWAVLCGTIWLVIKSIRFRDQRTPVDVCLLIWICSPIILFSVSWTPFYIHYLIPIFPAAYLILAFAGVDFASAIQKYSIIRKGALVLGGFVLSTILISQVWVWLVLLKFLDTEYTPDGFGTPIHYLNDIREAIFERQPQDVVARVGGQALVIDDNPTIWKALLYEVPSVRFEDDATTVYPQEKALYLENSCNADHTAFSLRDSVEGCYSIGELSAQDADLASFNNIAGQGIAFSNGVKIVGYRWEILDSACLYLAWKIDSITKAEYQFAIHFYKNGVQTVQADGLSWYGDYWRTGDLIIRQFCVSNEFKDMDQVIIGMYQYDGVQFYNVDVVDENQLTVGQTIILPLE